MNSLAQQLLGLVAACLTTTSLIPQVLQIWRSRSARDISLGMYLIFVTGIALWLAYGVIAGDLPLMLSNSVSLLLAGGILVMKLVFDRRQLTQ